MCGGQVAVESFYIISGFYMALVLNEKYLGDGSYKKFILSRFYRIFPVYWLVLLATVLFSVIGYYAFNKPYFLYRYVSPNQCLSGVTLFYFLLENLIVIGQDALYFLKIDNYCQPGFVYDVFSYNHTGYQYLFVPQAWSISIELMFYLIAPFLVTKKIKWQIAVILLSVTAKVYFGLNHYLYFDPWSYRFFPFELGHFMAGSLAYQIYTRIKNKELSDIIAYLFLAFSVAVIFFFKSFSTNDYLYSAVFYVIFAAGLPFIFKSFKNNRFDRTIGELSFSIYIVHLLVVSLYRPFFLQEITLVKYYGYAVVITSLLIALGLHYTVVVPLEKWRQKKIIEKS